MSCFKVLFDGVVITSSEGKPITLTCAFERIVAPIYTEDLEIELWLIEFQGYPGAKDAEFNPIGGSDLNANYIQIGGDPNSKRIVIAYVLLNHSDLRGKKVLSEIQSMLAKNISKKRFAGFKVYAEITHEKTSEQLVEIFKKYQSLKLSARRTMSQEKMAKDILNSYHFQESIRLGYNNFTINFEGLDDEIRSDNIIQVTYEIDPNLKKTSY